MAPLNLILMVAGFVLFLLAALNVGSPRFSLGWAGAACVTLAMILR